MARILILYYEMDSSDSSNYLVRLLAPVWREMGHEVLVHRGLANLPDADLAVLHVNLTRTPQDYLDALKRYPRVINGAVTDISKRLFSNQLVAKNDGYHGSVILKTDQNCGAGPERRFGRSRHSLVDRLKRAWSDLPRKYQYRRMNRLAGSRGRTGYWVVDHQDRLPGFVWRDPYWVVERFLPEQDEHGYYLRQWVFLGSQELGSRSLSAEPVVKSHNVVRREFVPVPEALREWRRKLGFDYGKFDYVVRDGEVILFDVNRTPTASNRASGELGPEIAQLARGIADFI